MIAAHVGVDGCNEWWTAFNQAATSLNSVYV